MHHLIRTDLEGVVGADSFTQTRAADAIPEEKHETMRQLAREVNACIQGIRDSDPSATISVWDQHGSGGLFAEDIEGATYKEGGDDAFAEYPDAEFKYDVGQHAMAGAYNAPLRHTYNSQDIEFYKLNGSFIGEFGCRALVAGQHGLPTVLISSDDKACLEAQQFIPEIETVITKFGRGEEAADHREADQVLSEIRETAARAATRAHSIPPFTGFDPPYELTIRYYEPEDTPSVNDTERVHRVDPRTITVRGETLMDIHGSGRL